MKIALGTAQFGLEYGVSNVSGRVSIQEVEKILDLAKTHGVETLDTAIAYGDSERTLGVAGVDDWKISTKLPELPNDCLDVLGWVNHQVEQSLMHLGVRQLHCLLLHYPVQLLGPQGRQLSEALQDIKKRKLALKVGVSIYSPEELDQLIDVTPIDVVQAPMSILDQRMVESGWSVRLRAGGTELHARSVFLQGLLLMSPTLRPARFSVFYSVWSEWSVWLERARLSPLQGCLAYALSLAEVDKVVVGVESVSQLKEILSARQVLLPNLPDWPRPVDKRLIDPRLWSRL